MMFENFLEGHKVKGNFGLNNHNMQKIKFTLTAKSHIGNIREKNEDGFSIDGTVYNGDEPICIKKALNTDRLLLEVCDGMGGEGNGDIAANIALRHSEMLYNMLKCVNPNDFFVNVNSYVKIVNDEICTAIRNTTSHRGGSTAALVYICNGVVYPFSIGDSRIYLFDRGSLKLISTDHTVAMRKYKSNIYTLEEAAQSIDRHKLTLFLGIDVEDHGLCAEAYEPIILEKGQMIILCSDGLYDMCKDTEMEKVLNKSSDNFAESLTKLALDHGGIDNITCVIAQVE